MRRHTAVIQMRFAQACLTNVFLIVFKQLRRQLSSNIDEACLCSSNIDEACLCMPNKMTNFNYELFKVSKMTNFDYDLFKVGRLDQSNTLHISPKKGIQNNQFSIAPFPTKKMSPKKGYIEMEGFFYLQTHLKCAGSVTFILLISGKMFIPTVCVQFCDAINFEINLI